MVFDGPEVHARIDDPSLGNESTASLHAQHRADRLSRCGGGREHASAELPHQKESTARCIGDGRQSGTSGSPSILNASPEAAAGGGLAILRTGDRVRIDLRKGEANMLVPEEELERRRADLTANGGYKYPAHQTPWQEIQRSMVDQLGNGGVLKPAVDYQQIAQTKGLPRDNH